MKSKILIILIFSIGYIFGQNTTNSKPNILWIITDDHRSDALECFNNATIGQSNSKLGYVSSPYANKLASEGTMYVNAYCNSPACAPSRASMITGQYPHHNGVYGFELAHNQSSTNKKIIPVILREQGYQTSLFGKSGNRILSWNGKSAGWKRPNYDDLFVNNKNDLQLKGFTDIDKGKEKRNGEVSHYEVFYDTKGVKTKIYTNDIKPSSKAKKIDKKYDILRAYTRFQSAMIIGGESPKPAGETLDGYLVKEFEHYFDNQNKTYKTFSERNVKGAITNKPQFVRLNFHLPHTPVLPPKKFRDQFKNKTYKIPEFNKEIEHKNLPPQLKKMYSKFKIDGLTYKEKQQAIQDYYAFCAYGDFLIEQATERFKKYCKDQNQEYLIVYTVGDHGWHLGEQGIEAKFAPYDTSNRGAIIVVSSENKYPKNKIVKDFVEYVDIAPTLLSAAGLNVSQKKYDYLDGVDLKKVSNKTTPPREYVLGEMNHVYGPRAYLRGKDFAFSMKVRKYNGKPNKKFPPNIDLKWAVKSPLKDVEVALYDLRNDPNETKNIALQKKYIELTEWFRKKTTDIFLGDKRVEVDWGQKDVYNISKFAVGADDKKMNIPTAIIPKI